MDEKDGKVGVIAPFSFLMETLYILDTSNLYVCTAITSRHNQLHNLPYLQLTQVPDPRMLSRGIYGIHHKIWGYRLSLA